MKYLFVAILIVWAVSAYAEAPVRMAEDNAYRPVQEIAPNYRKDVELTGTSVVIDVSNDLMWEANVSAAGAIFRTQSSATKAGVAHSLPAGIWKRQAVDHNTTSKTFLNISGGTSGSVRRQ